MKDPYSPTDITPEGPFPEGSAFYEDETHDLFVQIVGLGLYRVVSNQLLPTDKQHRDGFLNNFYTSGARLNESDYYYKLKSRNSQSQP